MRRGRWARKAAQGASDNAYATAGAARLSCWQAKPRHACQALAEAASTLPKFEA